MLRPTPPLPWKMLLVTMAYFVAGWAGLQIPSVGTHITLIWFPTGIAVAALVRWETAVWPGIYLGALLANLAIGSSLPLAAGIAVGNTLGPLLATAWLRHMGFHSAFDRQRDVGLFVVAACLGMTLSASGGVACLHLAGLLSPDDAISAWLNWWMGDTVGVLLAAPLALTLTRSSLTQLWRVRGELLLWAIVAGAIAWLAFVQDFAQLGRTLPLAFLTLPVLAWAALRFGITGAASAGLGFSVAATWSTATGHGTFFLSNAHVSLLLLWAYMATTAITVLLITALEAERRMAESILRESEQKLRGLFELSPLGIALTDMKGRYLDFNDAFQHICGYAADELKNLDYWQLTPRKYADDEHHQVESLQRTGRYGPYEKEYVRKDGGLVPLRLNGVLVTNRDGERRIWSIVEDISKQKSDERELRRAIEEAEAANQAKSQFLATMSHEIRTPLNAVLGMAQLLMDQEVNAEDRLDYARTIHHSGQTLLAILNDILDLSKVEAGKVVLERIAFAPAQLLQDVAALFAEIARAKGLGLEVAWLGEPTRHYRGDPVRLRQVLSNLVSNAIKFTEAGRVQVNVEEAGNSGNEILLCFYVSDRGMGIPHEASHLLFQPFSQVDASITRRFGGTGLGLAIAYRLVRLMGGDIDVESVPGRGSTFWFTARVELIDDGEGGVPKTGSA